MGFFSGKVLRVGSKNLETKGYCDLYLLEDDAMDTFWCRCFFAEGVTREAPKKGEIRFVRVTKLPNIYKEKIYFTGELLSSGFPTEKALDKLRAG